MSFDPDNTRHDQAVEDYLEDISNQLRLMNARIEIAFNTDIELDDIETLEDHNDGD